MSPRWARGGLVWVREDLCGLNVGPPWVRSGSAVDSRWAHGGPMWAHVDSRGSAGVYGFPVLGGLGVEAAAAPPDLALLSDFCSAALTISWVPDEMWPI